MRQLGFGTTDLSLHIDYDPAKHGDVLAYANGILKDFVPAQFPEDYAMIAAFTHLFADSVGYGAGYYSYKWAEVLDATRSRSFGGTASLTGRPAALFASAFSRAETVRIPPNCSGVSWDATRIRTLFWKGWGCWHERPESL